MKAALLILSVAVGTLLLFATVQYLNIRGSERVLNAIQAVRHGADKEQVKILIGRDPAVIPARTLPAWLKNVVPEQETGEYWYFYMGYPPRNLIIYFGDDEKVIFTTWAPT